MRHVTPHGPLVGLVGVPALLAGLGPAVPGGGLGPAGWAIGLLCGAVLTALLTAGLLRSARTRLLPADRVTLTRAVLTCGVAAVVADAMADPTGAAPGVGEPIAVLVVLASVALALDAVDGRVARRTGTVHRLGARFDMETDAFLILVLSVHVARDLGWWVLGIGAARYLLLLLALAARRTPWLRGQVPARWWRKVVAAYQGIVLTVAAAAVLPSLVAGLLVASALGLLVLSFATELVALRRLGSDRTAGAPATDPAPAPAPASTRPVAPLAPVDVRGLS